MIELRRPIEEDSLVIPIGQSEATIGDGSRGSGSLIGQTIADRYEIIEVLGIGGMGTVYLARQKSMNRLVAVKVLSPQFSQNPQMVRRFEKEANVVSKLSHPNTVAVFDYGRSEGCIYLVMERLEGVSLKTYLSERGPLRPKMAVHITTQILRSLHQAHGAGIIHRDIKPANIFVVSVTGEKHLIKVLDFGVAKLSQNASDDTVTQAGGIIGTPRYMAPEQARSLETDERADIYSAGIVLYELLSGSTPYNGENPIGIMMDHAQKPLPPMVLPYMETEQYGSLVQIVERCLEKKPKDRFADAESMLTALDSWQAPPLSTKPTPIQASPASERPIGSSPVRRAPIAALLFTLFLVVAGSWWLFQLSRENTVSPPAKSTNIDVKSIATPMMDKSASIRISITPQAEIIRAVDGFSYGQSPVEITVKSPLRLLAKKPGYATKPFTLTARSPAQLALTLSRRKKRQNGTFNRNMTRKTRARAKTVPQTDVRRLPAEKGTPNTLNTAEPDETDEPIEMQ